jgi:hypothetical protein
MGMLSNNWKGLADDNTENQVIELGLSFSRIVKNWHIEDVVRWIAAYA